MQRSKDDTLSNFQECAPQSSGVWSIVEDESIMNMKVMLFTNVAIIHRKDVITKYKYAKNIIQGELTAYMKDGIACSDV